MCIVLRIFPKLLVDPYYEPLAWFMIKNKEKIMTITVAETFYMQLASNLVTTGPFHLYLSLGVMQHAHVQLVGIREQLASDCFN